MEQLKEHGLNGDIGVITQKDRSNYVEQYNYGDVTANGLEKLDLPVKAVIEYDESGNIIYENYDALELFLDVDFIPNYVNMKKKIDKNTGDVIYFPSIQLNHIVSLKLSEIEVKYVLKYLNNLNIRVGGVSPDLANDLGIENYDYVRTYKEGKKNKYNADLNDEARVVEYQNTKNILLRNEIIENNMPLATYLSYKFSVITGINIHELESYAFEGLIYAVEHFDISMGCKLSTYAYPCIKGFILKGIPELEGFYKSNFYDGYISCKKIVEEVNGIKIEEEPRLTKDVFDLMVQTGKIGATNYSEFLRLINISKPVLVEDMDIYESEAEMENDLADQLTLEELGDVLKTLLPREEKVIRLRYGFDDGMPKTLEEVGRIIGITRERVRQIEAKALRKMRHPSRAKHFVNFFNN